MHVSSHDRAAGLLELERATVRWFLSINLDTMPDHLAETGIRTYRSVTVDGKEVEFSEGFGDLHTMSYHQILDGSGYGLDEALQSIQLVHDIRNSEPEGHGETSHELASLPASKHPFQR